MSTGAPIRRGCGRALPLLALLRGALLDDDEALLALALVPLERARDRVEPVRVLLVCAHRRERVFGRGHLDVVALFQFDAPAPVERRPRRRARVERHADPQLHRVRQQHRPERERVRADWRDQDRWDFGMYKRAASGERVGR